MDLNNFILIILLIIFSLAFYNYFLPILKKINPKFLIDNQFTKPQAFHDYPISTAGGLCIFISLLIVYFYFILFNKIISLEYFSFCFLFFALGFLDDIKININPKIRLILMIIILIFLVKYSNFYIEKTGIEILNNWLQDSQLFSLIFICLCFLFIINGANLVDGYNGLLGIHSLIILSNLFIINYLGENKDLANLLFFSIIILLLFLIFNFPKAKVFLGDSGSYFVGSFIAISTIKTSILNPSISPFYFCILLFYLFFEVFFSFFRKLFVTRQSPLLPDRKHLHMSLYKFLRKKNNKKLEVNYKVSIYLNLIYLLLIIPGIIFINDGLFCRYYFLFLLAVYIYFYKKLYEMAK